VPFRVRRVPGSGTLPRIDRERAALRRRWVAEGWYRGDTLADALAAGVRDHPDTMLHFVGEDHAGAVSLSEVLARGEVVASALHARGLRAGDVVAVQVPNWVEGAVAYAAAILLGAVIVPIVHIYGPAEVGFILRQSRARVLVLPDRWRRIDYAARLTELGEVPDVEAVVVIGTDVPDGAVAWADLERGPAAPLPAPTWTAADVAFQIYTSGTTGEPKGVQHSHDTMLAEVRSLAAMTPTGERGATLGSFPAGHIAGVLSFLRTFVIGTNSVLLDAWDASLAAGLVEEHGIESTAGTPYFITSFFEAADADGRDVSSLTKFMVGAANVPRAVIDLADARGVAAYRAYGSTEHPTVTSGSPEDPIDARAATDGRVTPGNEVRIVDDAGVDVAPGARGEVVTRGPELFLGYSDPAFDADAFLPGGWFRTGDIGVLDDGFLTIVDRKKDIIIRGGENIASKEVEDLLVEHPAVADAAAVAVPDPRLGETVGAFVVLLPGAALDLDEVRRFFRAAGVATQKTPERLEVVDALPRGPGGKVLKVELRRRLADR
jgi:acyl-CoA synthetase (AMP-forming)/AMP-acid ligase II